MRLIYENRYILNDLFIDIVHNTVRLMVPKNVITTAANESYGINTREVANINTGGFIPFFSNYFRSYSRCGVQPVATGFG